MIIGHGQQFGFPHRQPLLGRSALAFGTMPVAAGIIGDEGVGTVLTTRNVAAESRRAAALDGGHHLQLGKADMAGIGFAPESTVAAENIRDLQRWTGHETPPLMRAAQPSSSARSTDRAGS